jgi:hypothetical protein
VRVSEEEDTKPGTSDGQDWNWGPTQGRHMSVNPFAWAPRGVNKVEALSDITMNDMFLPMAGTVQMGHYIRNNLKEYWTTGGTTLHKIFTITV